MSKVLLHRWVRLDIMRELMVEVLVDLLKGWKGWLNWLDLGGVRKENWKVDWIIKLGWVIKIRKIKLDLLLGGGDWGYLDGVEIELGSGWRGYLVERMILKAVQHYHRIPTIIHILVRQLVKSINCRWRSPWQVKERLGVKGRFSYHKALRLSHGANHQAVDEVLCSYVAGIFVRQHSTPLHDNFRKNEKFWMREGGHLSVIL